MNIVLPMHKVGAVACQLPSYSYHLVTRSKFSGLTHTKTSIYLFCGMQTHDHIDQHSNSGGVALRHG